MDVFIGVGSNLGKRRENIEKACAYLESHPRITIEKVSSLIETEPYKAPPQPCFLNGVIKASTDMEPRQLLEFLQGIENMLGRVRGIANGPRTIDLDILLYGDKVIDEPGLKIPHPCMFEREFVMRPLLEIEPGITAKFKAHKT